MAGGAGWIIEYYTEPNGNCPVLDFITSLDTRTQTRIANAIDRLEAQGTSARFPLVRPVRGKIWELRIGGDKTEFRILYFTISGRIIVLLHGFQKQKEQTPKSAIELAQRRMNARSSP
jgi:phage-related protein